MTSNIGFVLNETTVTAPIIEEICDALLHHGKKFMRVGFIGTDRKTSHTLKKELYGHGFSLGFFQTLKKQRNGWSRSPYKEYTLPMAVFRLPRQKASCPKEPEAFFDRALGMRYHLAVKVRYRLGSRNC